MKKLLLIPLLFLITPYAKADMDYICAPSYVHEDGYVEFIKENCERNNILYFQALPRRMIPFTIASWCRHDREVNFIEETESTSFGIDSLLTCVLYDTEPRIVISY
tara:strand:- start:202 stop:519 length:318 start_codon:yes stop_codon:yes gene_type:complete